MSIEDLIRNGSIHPFRATSKEINKSVDIARRDVGLAENIVGESLIGLTPSLIMPFYRPAVLICFILDIDRLLTNLIKMFLNSCKPHWMTR